MGVAHNFDYVFKDNAAPSPGYPTIAVQRLDYAKKNVRILPAVGGPTRCFLLETERAA